MVDFNSTTFFLRSATSLFDIFDFGVVFVDGLAAAFDDVFAFFGCFLVVVEEGALFRSFGAGRVDFSASAADLTQTTLTDRRSGGLDDLPLFLLTCLVRMVRNRR